MWAILLAAAAARITNPVLLGLILAVAGWVVDLAAAIQSVGPFVRRPPAARASW